MNFARTRTALGSKGLPVLLLLSASLFALFSSLPLRADQTLSADQILKQLDDLQKQQTAAQQGSLASVLSEIAAAEGDSQAALVLYQKAVFEVQFNGAKGDNAAFQTWKSDHDLLFHDPSFTSALTLHLRYLELSIEYAKSGDPTPLIDPLLGFLQQLWDFEAKSAADAAAAAALADTDSNRKGRKSKGMDSDLAQSLLKQGISSSALAKYYQVDSLLSGLKDWEDTPGNDDGILNSTIFPSLRAAKKPALIQIWDQWIDHETDVSKQDPLTDQQEHFQNETLPKLQWSRALDLLALDRKDEAMTEMLSLIKTYPLHPDNPSWISQLRDIASGKPPQAAAS